MSSLSILVERYKQLFSVNLEEINRTKSKIRDSIQAAVIPDDPILRERIDYLLSLYRDRFEYVAELSDVRHGPLVREGKSPELIKAFSFLEDYEVPIKIDSLLMTLLILQLYDFNSESILSLSRGHTVEGFNLHSIYLRKCYHHFLSLVTDPRSPRGIIITGNPGIGKTIFGYVLMMWCMKEGKSFVYQTEKRSYCYHAKYHIFLTGSSFETYSVVSCDQDAYFIADALDITQPIDSKKILIASTRDKNYHTFAKNAPKYYMAPWDLEELSIYNSATRQLIDEELLDRFELFGGIPRRIFGFAIRDPERIIESRCRQVAAFLIAQKMYYFDADQSPELFLAERSTDLSFSVIQIIPNNPNDPYSATISLASPKIQTYLSECLRSALQKEYENFIVHACLNPRLGVLRGLFFESYVHQLFQKGGTFRAKQLCRHGKPLKLPYEEREKTMPRLNDTMVFNNVDECFADNGKGNYYRPHTTSYPSIDAFIQPNIFIQVTVAERHPIKWSLVLDRFFTQIQGDIDFYFVTIKDVFETFQCQDMVPGSYYDQKARCSKSISWEANNTHRFNQHVLCMIDRPAETFEISRSKKKKKL